MNFLKKVTKLNKNPNKIQFDKQIPEVELSKQIATASSELSMIKICECLSKPNDKFNTAEMNNLLEKHCLEHERLTYSSISKYIFNNLQCKETILSNADKLYSDESIRERKIIIKLWDHVNLVVHQIDNLQISNEQFHEKFTSEIPVITDKVNEKLESTNSQLISLVAIFTALSFLVFGNLTSLESIFSNINSACLSKVIILALMWGLYTFNTLVLFIYFVCKVSEKGFMKKEKYRLTYFQKYPIIVIGNYIICSLLTCSSWYYLCVYIISKNKLVNIICKDELENITRIFYMGLVILLIIIVAFGLILFCKKKHGNSSNEDEKNNKQKSGKD